MPNFRRSEERFPLLMLFLDDGSKTSKKHRNIFIDKSRYKNIASGASAVITEWPNHLTGCWLTTLLCALSIILLTMILFATTIRPISYTFLPMCKNVNLPNLSNNTKIFLVHNNDLLTQNELDAIEEMVKFYPDCDIQLLLYHHGGLLPKISPKIPEETTPNLLDKIRKKRGATIAEDASTTIRGLNEDLVPQNFFHFLITENGRKKRKRNIIVEKLVASPKVKNLDDLLMRYPKVQCQNLTQAFIFENSPLYMVYEDLAPEVIPFAIRVLQLWDNGGISFELPDAHKISDKNFLEFRQHNEDENSKILRLVELGYNSYKNLADGLVTIDDEGLHMETKTTCHAFFGEMIQYLRQASKETTVNDIIKKTLRSFCDRGAVDSEYCKNMR